MDLIQRIRNARTILWSQGIRSFIDGFGGSRYYVCYLSDEDLEWCKEYAAAKESPGAQPLTEGYAGCMLMGGGQPHLTGYVIGKKSDEHGQEMLVGLKLLPKETAE